MKKVINVIVIIVVAFALNFALPSKKAEAAAFGVAIPAGIIAGYGTYAVGVLALAALIGTSPNGSEYEAEMNAHAQRQWETGTQLAKDSMGVMINSAKGLGNAMTATDANFNTWTETILGNLATEAYNVSRGHDVDTGIKYSKNAGSYTNEFNIVGSNATNVAIGLKIMANGVEAQQVSIRTNTNGSPSPWVIVEYLPVGSSVQKQIIKYMTASEVQFIGTQISQIATLQMGLSRMAEHGMSVAMGTTANPLDMNIFNNGVSKVREAWESMRDAGLVLPVDSAIPTYQNNPANYNEQTDTYTGVDGGVINPSDLTWNFPKPRVRDGTETDVPAPLAPGVYVDTPPITGNPAIDGAGATTTTNVITGETTTTNVGTGDGGTGGNPPKENSGDPVNPFKNKPVPIALLLSLFQLLAALIFYLLRLFAFIVTLGLIAPTPINNEAFLWFKELTILGITPYPFVINLAIFFLSFSIYKSVRRVFN